MWPIRKVSVFILILFLFVPNGWTAAMQNEPVYLGRPFSYWLKCIHDRDLERIDRAFDAMVEFGPEAWPAVPELTSIIAEPFVPIHVGVDSQSAIVAKVRNMRLRSGAIDSLGAIGEAAAPSAETLIEWALAVRVVGPETRSPAANAVFVDLVAIDVLERMRAAGAIAALGVEAAPAVQALLESPDTERQKLSVAILNVGVLPIVADLMKSPDCLDRERGMKLLSNMWPVIPKDHLLTLQEMSACRLNANGVRSNKMRSSDAEPH